MTSADVPEEKTPSPQRDDLLRQAAEVAASVSDRGGPRRITLSNGIILDIKSVPPFAIREAVSKLEPPKVPVWHNEAKDTDEENPNDPDYLEAVQKFRVDQLLLLNDVMLLLGSSAHHIPDGVSKPEDDDWIEALTSIGLNVQVDNKFKRYAAWLRYYALESDADIAQLTSSCLMNSGVTEREVQRAIASFRDLSERRTDRDSTAEEADTD